MKRSERHHLKQNALAAGLADLQYRLETHRREIVIWVLLVTVGLMAAGGYVSYRRSQSAQGADLLADALNTATAPVIPPAPLPDPMNPNATPPAAAYQPGSFTSEGRRTEAALAKFILAADAYPDNPAGITARYHAATLLAVLGRRDEAATQYQQVVDSAGEHIYGQMASLGLAETQLHAGKVDVAIEMFQRELNRPASNVPVDGVLMHLARAYLLAGRTEAAEENFARIVDEFPESIYGPIAQAELDKLQEIDAG